MSRYEFTKTFTLQGKRYYAYGHTLEEAIKKAAIKEQKLINNTVILESGMSVSAWAKECIETYKTRMQYETRKKLWSKVKHCILQEIGFMPLKSVKPLHCQNVLNKMASKSTAYINDIYQAMNFIFLKAVQNELIKSNPAEYIVRPQGTKTRRRAITSAEEEHIRKVAVTDRRYYLYLLMLDCGCRPSEAAQARGEDIIVVDGYNMLHIRGTKSVNADRIVPLPDGLYGLIKNTHRESYIACNSRGKPIVLDKRSLLWKSFKRHLNISMGCKMYRNKLLPPYPVAPDLVPYCLRHTYCTNLARRGIDIRMAQKLMGHSDISLTANIYTNYDSDDVVEVAKRLDCTTPCTTPNRSNYGKLRL